MYTINWTRAATKQLQRIDRQGQKAIVAAVGALAEPDSARNVKALVDHKYGFRLRVGNYRVLFDLDTVIRIAKIQEVRRRDGKTC